MGNVREVLNMFDGLPAEQLVFLLAVGALGGLLLPWIAQLMHYPFRRDTMSLDSEHVHELEIHASERYRDVRIPNSLFQNRPFKRGELLKIFSLQPDNKGKYKRLGTDIEIVWSFTAEGNKNKIELPLEVFHTLFPQDDVTEKKTGIFHFNIGKQNWFEKFWDNTSDAERIANRMGVFIALTLLIFELGFDFIPLEIRPFLIIFIGLVILLLMARSNKK